MYTGQQINIEEHPLSLLIPVNETAFFSCKAHCARKCNIIYWVINATHAYDNYKQEQFKQIGFTFSEDKEDENSNEYIGTLTVNATEAINNTQMYCVFEETVGNGSSVHSKNATLLTIAGKYMQLNILMKQLSCKAANIYKLYLVSLTVQSHQSIEKNSTHLTLLWSPPFLWPGQRIQNYNITFVNKTDGSIAYYSVNGTFGDQVVRFSRMIYQNEKCTSTKIEFRILADGISEPLPTPFNVTEWIHPSGMIIIIVLNNYILYYS